MRNRPFSRAEGIHLAEILQSPRTEDEAKIFGTGWVATLDEVNLGYEISSV